jgi:hypothetical protein
VPLDADYHVDSFTALRIGLGHGMVEPWAFEAVFTANPLFPYKIKRA